MGDVFQTIAYHTNKIETALKNELWQTFYISRDKPPREQWLGDGIYFWENKEDAEWWPGDTILSAKLTCEYDKYVNLDEREEWEAFIQFCRELKKAMDESEHAFEFSEGKFQVSSFYFNNFKEMNDLMLLKYSFPRKGNRPQYCATDNGIVSDIRIVARTVADKLEWSII